VVANGEYAEESGVRFLFFTNRQVVVVCRFVLGLTFLVSSFGKLVDIEHYSVAMVYNMDILPHAAAIAFGWALPFIELLCGLGLVFGVLTRLSAVGVGLLSISFFITKAILLARGTDVECGCFGAIGSAMASWSIYLDPAMLIASLPIVLAPRARRHWVALGGKLPERWQRKLDAVW
jgi:hypothetical protein